MEPLVSEPRLNALIIIADRLSTDRVIRLISKLDTQQGSSGETQLKLVRLENTSAKRMANLLTRIFSAQLVAEKQETNNKKHRTRTRGLTKKHFRPLDTSKT